LYNIIASPPGLGLQIVRLRHVIEIACGIRSSLYSKPHKSESASMSPGDADPPVMTRQPSLRPRRPSRTLPSEPIQTNTQPEPGLASSPIAGDPARSNQNAPDARVDGTDASDTSEPNDLSVLTPIRAHYLKKTLIQLQFNKELDIVTSPALGSISPFSYLGAPFKPPPKDAPRISLPFLRYIFRQFVLTFPFLDETPKNFFPDKLQPFAASVLAKNLSPTSIMDEDAEQIGEAAKSTRKKLMTKAERSLSILLSSGIKLVEPEQVVRLSQADLNRLEAIAKNRLARERKSKDALDVNIICVRTVVSKGRVRSRAHDVCILFHKRPLEVNLQIHRSSSSGHAEEGAPMFLSVADTETLERLRMRSVDETHTRPRCSCSLSCAKHARMR
jgi:hypothetical protein